MLIIFDVVGTLFSLDTVKEKFHERGLRQELVELWLAKLLQSAMASTLAGKYIPFTDLAASTLQQIAVLDDVDERDLDDLLFSLHEIEPYGDARECLRTLRSHGHRLAALTNTSYDEAERLLDRADLRKEFERLYSADMTRACKPHPALHELLFRTMFVGPYDCCMVAAHGWDILGAQAIGMNTIYVNRLEKLWPFPEGPSGFIVSNLREVPFAVSCHQERPESLKQAA